MSEAAAMTLATKMASLLHLQMPNYLTYNQQLLVTFFNSVDHSTPPDWRIKTLTQQFINYNSGSNYSIYKFSRNTNRTAHILAKQAKIATSSTSSHPSISCTNQAHVSICPLQQALSSVQWECISLLTARCC